MPCLHLHASAAQVRQLHSAAEEGQYDAFAWEQVVDDLRGLPLSDDTRAAYEEVLTVMPSAVRAPGFATQPALPFQLGLQELMWPVQHRLYQLDGIT